MATTTEPRSGLPASKAAVWMDATDAVGPRITTFAEAVARLVGDGWATADAEAAIASGRRITSEHFAFVCPPPQRRG